MQIVKRTKEDYITSRWSGGTTTELAIWPPGSQYGERNFLFRISSAVVEMQESTFTPLPDYRRIISPLKGDLQLIHNGGTPVILHPLEFNEFDGAWNTVSKGRVTDFNLMTRKGKAAGEAKACGMAAGERISFRSWRHFPMEGQAGSQAKSLENTERICMIFCTEGEITLKAGTTEFLLKQGEMALAVPEEEPAGEKKNSGEEPPAIIAGKSGAAYIAATVELSA